MARPPHPLFRPRLAALVLALALAGCTLDPDYQRPDLPTAPEYPSRDAAYQRDRAHQPPPGAEPAAADLVGWRRVFPDPRLQKLIALALDNNRDLRVAVLNIAGAQAQLGVQQANLFPMINATASPAVLSEPTAAVSPTNGAGTGHAIYKLYSAGVGFANYELDVFGRIRSLTRAAAEQYLNAVDTRRSVQISLVAEVADAYITLRGDEAELAVAKQTLDSQLRSYDLTKQLVDRGASTLLTLRQAETTVDTARASVAQFTRQAAQDKNALTLLVGAPLPDDLPPGRNLGGQDILGNLPAGLPSELLTQRPDITAAEHALLAANAQIGAARAAFFPKITLTGSDGLQSSDLQKLFTSGATTWTFQPTITLPIFTWGQNQANLDFAKVQKSVEIATYEKTIQTAFREVSDALAARGTYLDQLAAQQKLVDANADSYRLSELRFRNGVDTFLAALIAQQSLFQSQQALLSLKAAQLQNLVTLYKALGGGWYQDTTTPADAAAATPPAPPTLPTSPW